MKVFHLSPPSYLLKVTKFSVKVSQFEFSIMTEQNILIYKLFLSLNISDFSLFLFKNRNPSHPLKNGGPIKQPPPPRSLFENLIRGLTPLAERGDAYHVPA